MPVSSKPRGYAARRRARQNWIDAGRPLNGNWRTHDVLKAYDPQPVPEPQQVKPQAQSTAKPWLHNVWRAVGRVFGRSGQ